MARPNVLFMIHGIGTHLEGWVESPKKILNDAAKNYVAFTDPDAPLKDQIELIEIRYDDIFDALLDNFEQLAQQFEPVRSDVIPNPVKKINKVFGELDGVAEKYLGDIFLYKGFRLVQRVVLLQVMAQIAETIKQIGLDHQGTPVKYGLLAHSMGTTVAHDALHLLATTPWIDPAPVLDDLAAVKPDVATDLRTRFGNNPFSPGNFRFDSIFMISNTSRLLHTTNDDPYHSFVRPASLSSRNGVCDSFYNIDHKLDPVSKLRRFRIFDAWRADNEGAEEIEVEHFHEANVHALEHYLLHPYVHGSIFGQLAPGFSPNDWDDAWKRVDDGRFEQWGQKFDTAPIKNRLQRKLRNLIPETVGQETIDKWLKIEKALKQLEAIL